MAAIRPYLLTKAVLILLAFDLWMVRLPAASTRGLDYFNVAHFAWLDAVQPLPDTSAFTGILLLSGALALFCAISAPSFWAMGLLALGYTYSWAMSMLDGYQHHYFLSLVILAFLFFPRLRARDLYPGRGGSFTASSTSSTPPALRRVSAWGYVLLGVNIAILYFFTAITKATEEQFVNGWIVRRLTRRELATRLEGWAALIGIPGDALWPIAASGTIALELLLAAAYLVAIKQDTRESRRLRSICLLAFAAVVAFHGLGNEMLLALSIGWFSYYMIALGAVYLLPENILWRLGWLSTWPGLRLARIGGAVIRAVESRKASGIIALPMTLLFAGTILAAGLSLDLAGARAVAYLLALVVLGFMVIGFLRGSHAAGLGYSLAMTLGVLFMWAGITFSTVRFEYYERLGAAHKSIGNLAAAIAAYEKARLYVPLTKRKLLTEKIAPESLTPARTEESFQDLIVGADG
ncbi:MAG TPA: HTTM domain-containing protein [Candidatus Acidoferrales bacterium]|nr:HTTM domain-containing protein [Candidatus Acidoferrales bacterium]